MYQKVKLANKATKIDNPLTKSLRMVQGTLPYDVAPSWGIDPGVNFGLTVIENSKLFVFNGSLISDEKPGRRGLIAFRFLSKLIEQFAAYTKDASLVIEGASYGDQYGQVLLSEVRTGFYLAAALSPYFSSVEIVAPKSIRKEVFGSGDIRARDEWPTLNINAADSLAMALLAAHPEE